MTNALITTLVTTNTNTVIMDFLPSVLPTLSGITIAILASYLTSKWSIKKFYTERKWERKEVAYVKIIDALYDLIQYCEIRKNDYRYGTELLEQKENELRKKYNLAYWNIKKATDIAAFVVSKKGQTILKELQNRPRLEWNENPPFEIYEEEYKYYQIALEKIIEIAKKDLK